MSAVATKSTLAGKRAFEGMDAAKSWLRNKVRQSEAEAFTEKVLVNPDIARALLANNPNNRKLKPAKFAQFSDDMKNGRWQFNGENIIVAKSGELNDGQHRLEAIIHSQTEQWMNITFGVARGTRYTVDSGMARNAGDQLKLQGFAHPAQVAGVTRLVVAHERANKQHLGRPNEVSSQVAQERARTDRELVDAAQWAGNNTKKMAPMLMASIVGFCFYEFAQVDREKAKEFMNKVRDGADLSSNSPVFVARQKLLLGKRLTNLERVEIMFRAFNLYLKDFTATSIRTYGNLPKLGS